MWIYMTKNLYIMKVLGCVGLRKGQNASITKYQERSKIYPDMPLRKEKTFHICNILNTRHVSSNVGQSELVTKLLKIET